MENKSKVANQLFGGKNLTIKYENDEARLWLALLFCILILVIFVWNQTCVKSHRVIP